MLNIGKCPTESLEDYHNADALSKTKLDVFRYNPELYRRRFVSKEIPKPEPTAAMLFGQQAGCYIMEGLSVFRQRYYVVPEGTGKQKKEHKDLRTQLIEQHPGKQAVDYDDFQTMRAMDASLRKNAVFSELMAQGEPEVTFRIRGQHFYVQVRPDWWCEKGCALTKCRPYIVDLKTIAKLPQDEPDHLGKHIAEWGYHRSAYTYSEIAPLALGWPADTPRPLFYLAFTEKEEPHHCEVVELTDLDREIGERETNDSIRKLRRCMETGIWSDPRTEPRKVSLPNYYVRRALENTESILA